MADLSITASAVVPGTGAVTLSGAAGEAISAGQAVAKDTNLNDGKIYLADADNANRNVVIGLAVNTASAVDQPVSYATGSVTIGGSQTVGTVYYLSGTPGGIAPVADLASGDRVAIIGVISSSTAMLVSPLNSGIDIP